MENLLEAYFILIDNAFDKLETLDEFIDDTEDLINLELDSHRNQLIQLELILTTCTFAVAVAGMVAGIFGMNIPYGIDGGGTPPWVFYVVVVATLGGCFLMFAGIYVYCKRKGILT